MVGERKVKYGFSHMNDETITHFGIAPPIKADEAREVLQYLLEHSDARHAKGEIPKPEQPSDFSPAHTEITLKEFDGDPLCVLRAIEIQLERQGYLPKSDILPKPIRPDLHIGIGVYMREGSLQQTLPRD